MEVEMYFLMTLPILGFVSGYLLAKSGLTIREILGFGK